MFRHVRLITRRDFLQEKREFAEHWDISPFEDPVLGYCLKYKPVYGTRFAIDYGTRFAIQMVAFTDDINDKIDPSDWDAELISQSTFYRRRRKALTMASSPDGSFSHDEIEKAMRIIEGLT